MAEVERLAQGSARLRPAVGASQCRAEVDQRMDLLQTRRARVGHRHRLGEQLQSSVSALSQAKHAQVPDHDAADARRPGEIQLFGPEVLGTLSLAEGKVCER